MEGDGQLNGAEAGGQVAAADRADADDFGAQFLGQLPQLPAFQFLYVSR